jgi:hypothetical protein
LTYSTKKRGERKNIGCGSEKKEDRDVTVELEVQ